MYRTRHTKKRFAIEFYDYFVVCLFFAFAASLKIRWFSQLTNNMYVILRKVKQSQSQMKDDFFSAYEIKLIKSRKGGFILTARETNKSFWWKKRIFLPTKLITGITSSPCYIPKSCPEEQNGHMKHTKKCKTHLVVFFRWFLAIYENSQRANLFPLSPQHKQKIWKIHQALAIIIQMWKYVNRSRHNIVLYVQICFHEWAAGNQQRISSANHFFPRFPFAITRKAYHKFFMKNEVQTATACAIITKTLLTNHRG